MSTDPLARALRVMDWADLHGDDLAGALRLDEEIDVEIIAVVNDALLAAGDAYYALRARDEVPLTKCPSCVGLSADVTRLERTSDSLKASADAWMVRARDAAQECAAAEVRVKELEQQTVSALTGALEVLVAACEAEFTSDDTEGPDEYDEPHQPDNSEVASPHSHITFGMIRDARASLRSLEGALPSSVVPWRCSCGGEVTTATCGICGSPHASCHCGPDEACSAIPCEGTPPDRVKLRTLEHEAWCGVFVGSVSCTCGVVLGGGS